MKKIIIILLICSLICIPKSINADNIKESSISKQNETFSFDLSSNYQEISFIDDDGLLTIITIENSRSITGEKTITYENSKIIARYKININNGVITKAYDKYCYSNWWTITNDVLTKDSNYKATYAITMKRLFSTCTRYLKVDISNCNLNITFN